MPAAARPTAGARPAAVRRGACGARQHDGSDNCGEAWRRRKQRSIILPRRSAARSGDRDAAPLRGGRDYRSTCQQRRRSDGRAPAILAGGLRRYHGSTASTPTTSPRPAVDTTAMSPRARLQRQVAQRRVRTAACRDDGIDVGRRARGASPAASASGCAARRPLSRDRRVRHVKLRKEPRDRRRASPPIPLRLALLGVVRAGSRRDHARPGQRTAAETRAPPSRDRSSSMSLAATTSKRSPAIRDEHRPRLEHHVHAVGERRDLQHRDDREVADEALLLRVEDDSVSSGPSTTSTPTSSSSKVAAARRPKYGLRIPDEQHRPRRRLPRSPR